MNLGVFTGTIDLVQKDPSGYIRFSGVTASPADVFTNAQIMVLYKNTPNQMKALLAPVSRVSAQELHDFENGVLTSSQIQDRIDHREQRHEPKEYPI